MTSNVATGLNTWLDLKSIENWKSQPLKYIWRFQETTKIKNNTKKNMPVQGVIWQHKQCRLCEIFKQGTVQLKPTKRLR